MMRLLALGVVLAMLTASRCGPNPSRPRTVPDERAPVPTEQQP